MESEILDTLAWRLDALEMLADRAHEMCINGEYGEAQRILSVLGCLIEECQLAINSED